MSQTDLKKADTRAPKNLKKTKILKENAKMIEKIQAYQYKMFAEGKRSVLIVLQWLDASGKDGVVKYIFSGMNPLGTRATSFRVPTKEELSHDFLWRIHQETPAHGTVQIFNRSHYEDILVPTVEKLIDKKIINKRYDHINNFEKMLEEQWTTIVKFYLNISKDKQKEKLNERLTDPTKYWKHNIGDWDTRDNYDEYIDVYENIFDKCNKPERHIIAADQNRYKIYQISKVLLKVFEEMELKWPKLSPDQETSYLKAKAELAENRDLKEIAKEKAKADAKIAEEKVKETRKQAKKKEKTDAKIAEEKAKEEKKQAKKKIKADAKLAEEKAKAMEKQVKDQKKAEIKLAKEKAKLAKEKVKAAKKQILINKVPAKKPVAITKKPVAIAKKPVTTKPTLIKTPTITKQVTSK